MNEMIPETTVRDVLNWLQIGKALLMLVAGWLLAGAASRLFRRTTRFKLGPHLLAIYSRLIFYGIVTLFIVSAIRQLGFDISVLLGAAGILTVAVGFASQTSASNLISGLFLLGEKPFEVGDVLRVDDNTGEVVSIDLLSVKLRTFDNLFVRIPNELLIKSRLVNLTRFPIRRIDLSVGVAYREDLQQVIALLLEIANNERRCLEEPQPFCGVSNFGTSSVDLQLSVWARREIYRELKSDLMVAIKARFDAQGIEIPFPHLAVYAGSRTAPIPIKTLTDTTP
jgi:small-conductance mechanosensitive channel